MSDIPELVFVAGCNAAGKSSFIRSRLSELDGFEIIMTDVYKGRSKEVFRQALAARKDIILETVFNDASFKDLVDEARDAGYFSSLIVLFLDSPQQSIDRVAFRTLQQTGLHISGDNVRLNFNESFKNIAAYYFYFDQADFFYTGETNENRLIMTFHQSTLIGYQQSDLQYPQKFAVYSSAHGRLDTQSQQIITDNKDHGQKQSKGPRRKQAIRFRI